ncbi:2,4-dienoyl-CoA reductase [Marinactinospora thermotolerans DSM 45154]|uniref:2,4-dienoyl-CoA reductase n=1 Tax=Marinactinospora thermotolerans DSM 45154 TaxID=1122192 RepID=A0A1T4TEN4_9ACTN|nr:NADH:flavin oxidoreductase/NADH oxidase [Marinactinospora thermotolerans]SKA38659.1 2,4-dienoyl-CoA reductase [Marinactinospora thermotolerans DSM 45154]
MTVLFEPLTLRSLTVPNRVWMSPMCTYSAATEGPEAGVPTDWHFAHLAARAAGGAGLVMVEATGVHPDGRISPADLGLWNDRQQEAFTRITRFIRDQGAVPAIQLAHAGRKASTRQPWLGGGPIDPADGGWKTAGPSPIPFGDFPAPEELSTRQIADVIASFADAARRAHAAGFQVAEIHGAHGYLINTFLSPQGNRRTDAYGGSFENRIRLALEIIEAVREVWPEELPLFFRVSATDWLSGDTDDPREGWSGEDTVRLAKELQARGVDLLDTSTGGMVPVAPIPVAPNYQVPFAARVRSETGLPTAAVGLITEAAQAEEIVSSGQADAVMIGRQLLRDPYWPLRAAAELGSRVQWPIQYGYAV